MWLMFYHPNGSIRFAWYSVKNLFLLIINSLPSHASGINIIITCGNERPACTSNSIALSRLDESDCAGLQIGRIISNSSRVKWEEEKNASFDFSQLMLPCTVLISHCARWIGTAAPIAKKEMYWWRSVRITASADTTSSFCKSWK